MPGKGTQENYEISGIQNCRQPNPVTLRLFAMPASDFRSKSTAKGEEAKNGARRLFQETDLPSLNQEQHFFFLWQGISSSLHATTITLQFTKGNMRFFEDLKVIKS